MINFIQSWGSLIISGLSLVLAVISYAKASESQQLQNRVNTLELKIKQYEIEKISKEQAAANSACIEARVIKLGKNNYRLKVWNSGGADARNVNIAVDNSQEFIIINNNILPFEILSPNKSIEIPVLTGFGASKFKITTSWKDTNGEYNQHEQYVSL